VAFPDNQNHKRKDKKMNEELPTFWHQEPAKKKLPNETTDEWVVRVFGAFPDTEFDQRNDFRCLNLPTTAKENAEGFGIFDYGQDKQ
jgi:hypothetical protein